MHLQVAKDRGLVLIIAVKFQNLKRTLGTHLSAVMSISFFHTTIGRVKNMLKLKYVDCFSIVQRRREDLKTGTLDIRTL